MKTNIDELKDYLVSGGYLSPEEFESAKKTHIGTGQEFTDVLIEKGLFNEEFLAKALAGYYGVPYVNLAQKEIDDKVLHVIPEDAARENMVIAFEETEGVLLVAMKDPGDLAATGLIEKMVGKKLKTFITTPASIRNALTRYQMRIGAEFEEIIQKNIEETSKLKGSAQDIARDVPVINIFDTIMKHAVSARATDIHVEPQEKRVLIRYRIDGILKEITTLPLSIEQAIIARIKILSALRVDEHLRPQDGRFKYSLGETKVAIRVSILPTFHGEKAVLRLLEENVRALTLEELGMAPEMAKELVGQINKPHGMVLVTGPTGAGKSTTLYTILHIRNTPEVNIETVEDPIEYEIPGVNQTQVNEQAEMTFANGLRSILRQSPDIIMVGEIRDVETAELAIHAALTGHLLLTTLHTNDAVGAVPRLIDMGVKDFLIASTLNLSMAQRLVRRICSSCIQAFNVNPELLASIRKQLKDSDPSIPESSFPNAFYKGKGCKVCGGTGYQGRIGVFELFVVDDTARNMVAKGASEPDIKQYAKQKGMKSMLEDGLSKVSSGVTTIDEIIRILEE